MSTVLYLSVVKAAFEPFQVSCHVQVNIRSVARAEHPLNQWAIGLSVAHLLGAVIPSFVSLTCIWTAVSGSAWIN